VVIGKNPNSLFSNLGFEVDRIQRGSIVNQMKAIVRSSADFHLVLNKKNEYSNNSEAMYTYVERGIFGIPIASIPVTPFKEIIEDRVNGYILKTRNDLPKLITALMKDKTELIEISTKLKNNIVSQFQLDEEKRSHLIEIFFNDFVTMETGTSEIITDENQPIDKVDED